MKLSTFFTALMFISCIGISQARITSFGLQTALAARNMLNDSDYVVTPDNGVIINTPNFRVRIAELSNFPVLGLIDVQSQVIRVSLKAGADFIPHFHPRGVEVLSPLKGNFRITITYDGLNPRKVTNIVRPGQSIPFPQGLIHETQCVSRRITCQFLSIFNTADPGLIPVTV